MRASWLVLPFLTGCLGVYAEVATTTLPSATIDGSTNTGATSVGFNIGADFGSTRMRFALGYASDTTTFDGGSAKLGTSSSRFDFNIFSLTDRARIRLGLGFARGSGSSEAGGMKRTDSEGGGVFAGLDVTYFLTWKLGLHAFVGPTYMSQTIPGGSVSGTGATFRIAASFTFGDVRPDTTLFIPLENRDITGLLEAGAEAAGCRATRDSNPSSGYAFLHVTCRGREVLYLQIAEGISARCFDMFEHECKAFTARLTDATAPAVTGPAAPAPAPAPTPAPAPAPAPVPVAEPIPPATPAGEPVVAPPQP
ncbi:MAG: hypothetical protein H7287_09575 [Thermoleophilia bacterium]|nr:hypothetical protein [Thermoleophilia bacterium]